VTDAEQQLRDGLRGLAERAGSPSADGPGLARRIARDSADRRRSRRNVLVGIGGVLLLGLAVPLLPDSGPGGAEPTSGPVAGTVSVPGPDFGPGPATASGDGEIFGGPTRGSLAGDRAFVEAVRLLPWTQQPPLPVPAEEGVTYYVPDPPVETRSVVFAGEVGSERWALVLGRIPAVPPGEAGAPAGEPQPEQLMVAWFTGPAGAGAEQMTMRLGPGGIGPDWPLAATDPRTGALVVVAAAGDVVQVSDGPEIGRDGSTTREWREVETVDGIAVTQVAAAPRPFDAATSYRVLRDGRIEARDMPWSFVTDQPPTPVPVQYPRGRPSEVGERAARFAAEHVLAEVGLSPAQVEVTAQWVGSVPAGEAGQAAVVTVTLPSGAVVVEGQVLLPEGPDGATNGAFCGLAIQPAGPPAGRRVQAMACEVMDYTTGRPMSTSLVVVGPPEVVLIRTYDDDRTFLSEHAAVDGVLVVPLPLGTDTVEAVTSAGVTLGRVELLGRTADFGD
jgi:hypothetical protein